MSKELCQHCDGTGEGHSEYDGPCRVCHGSGMVPDDDTNQSEEDAKDRDMEARGDEMRDEGRGRFV